MLLAYFHDSPFAGYLGAQKTFHKLTANIWWPNMRTDQYVCKCGLSQRGKPTQNTRVVWHNAEPSTQPTQKLFAEFVGPFTRTKLGNVAILVVLDSFSKFVSFYPVRMIAASVVIDCFERRCFPAYGEPNSIVTDNANVFRSKQVKVLCFRWGVEHVFTTP